MRGDITKLPKWAQAEIQRLERQLAEEKAVTDDSQVQRELKEEAQAELLRLRDGLLSLKGEELVTIPGSDTFKATRVTSYVALNGKIDRILESA